jgi:hypothetical protein
MRFDRTPPMRHWAVAVAVSALLAACGGAHNDSTPVVATADAYTLAAGQSANLLANDQIGGQPATITNASFTLTSGAPPAGVTATNGTVTVGAAAAPAVVTLSYRLCDIADSGNCATTTAAITIPAPAIVAVADSFTLASGESGDVLANDTLGGVPATAATVTASASATLPTGVTLSAAGLVSVGTTATPGAYSVAYRICQIVASTNCATATASVTVPAAGSVSGRVVDAATALGIGGVRVAAGGVSATTDATGAFNLTGVTSGERVNIEFSASTHSETSRVVNVSGSGTTDVQARMVALGISAPVDVATGGTVSVPGSSARVVLPAAGVQRADGSLPTGEMTVRLTPIAPASDTAVMPGDFTTLVGGVATPIESFGALNVTLSDSAGVALNLRAGQTATIRIPLSTRSSSPPATVPLYFYSPSLGRWVEEGTATLAGTGTARYYEGTVTHFTTWNADQVYNTVRVTSCVADANGARIAGARISSDGVDYSGISSAVSDAAGNFTIAIRRSSRAVLTGISGGSLTNSFTAGPYTEDATISTCLTLGQLGSGVTMKLTWGERPSDLDSYLFTPSGAIISYSSIGSLTAAPFANLDVDDTSSFGPEVVTLSRLMVGTYKYAVNNYSGQGSGFIGASGARVELSIPGRSIELYTPPGTGETASTNWWQLFELDVDAQCNITVRRTGSFSASPPVASTSSTPVYCVRPT